MCYHACNDGACVFVCVCIQHDTACVNINGIFLLAGYHDEVDKVRVCSLKSRVLFACACTPVLPSCASCGGEFNFFSNVIYLLTT